jgi:hypothetical protein
MDWIDLAQDRTQWKGLENTTINLRVLTRENNFLNACWTVRFSRTPVHGSSQIPASNPHIENCVK